jgi:hypothetical protein
MALWVDSFFPQWLFCGHFRYPACRFAVETGKMEMTAMREVKKEVKMTMTLKRKNQRRHFPKMENDTDLSYIPSKAKW